ncbi:MAG TPA: glycosyltransferase [Acidobacteriota bacterium]|nr:glycosyltransferase [Acidobacteriota bacterium]
MKILFIGSLKYDYLQDIVFSGLTKVVGRRNLHTARPHMNYLLPFKRYPRNLGYDIRSVRSARFIRRAGALFAGPLNCDAVIVGACKPDAFERYLAVLPRIPAKTRVVFVDGGDAEEIGGDLKRQGYGRLWDEALRRPFDIIFKREYLRDGEYDPNVYPCPFAFNFDRIAKIKDRGLKYEVTFWAVESHPVRTKALEMIETEFDCAANGTVRNQTHKNYPRRGLFYLEELKSSKITLNFRGGGWDTLRYWEVPALGRFMISQKPGIAIPDDFIDGKHVVHVSEDLSDLVDLCRCYLRNDKLRETMARAAGLHARKHHSDVERASYLLNIIAGKTR